MTPEPHHKKIHLTFFNQNKSAFLIQILAHAPVLLFINHNALSVNPDSQTAIHYCVCPAKAFYYDAALQFHDVIAYRCVIETEKDTQKDGRYTTLLQMIK